MRWELDLCRQRPPLSLNVRVHWAVARKERLALQADMVKLLRYHKVPAMDHAWIWLDWTPGTVRRRDTDNPEPTRKACVDQIVRCGLLEDDTPEFVTRPENVIHPAVKGIGRLVLVICNSAPELSPASRGAA